MTLDQDESDDEDSKELTEEENENKRRYDASCDILRTSIRELEEIQTNIVKLLLTKDDCTDQVKIITLIRKLNLLVIKTKLCQSEKKCSLKLAFTSQIKNYAKLTRVRK